MGCSYADLWIKNRGLGSWNDDKGSAMWESSIQWTEYPQGYSGPGEKVEGRDTRGSTGKGKARGASPWAVWSHPTAPRSPSGVLSTRFDCVLPITIRVLGVQVWSCERMRPERKRGGNIDPSIICRRRKQQLMKTSVFTSKFTICAQRLMLQRRTGRGRQYMNDGNYDSVNPEREY